MSEIEPRLESKEKFELSPEDIAERDRLAAEVREREAAKAEASKDSIESIRERLERAQEKQETPQLNNAETSASETGHMSSTGLKSHAANQAIRKIQKQLPARDRVFSRVIHQPAVEAVSNAAEVSVARPSGLLIGGLFSLVSSLVVLYICRHYGYEYNFLVGIGSFAGGFLLGIIAEGLYKLFNKLVKH